MTEPKQLLEVVKEDPPLPEEPQSPLMRVGLTILRFLSAIAVPIVAFTILWLSFEWLRDADVNRGIIVLVAVLVGVGGIFALYWAMDYAVNKMPEKWRETVRPWVFVGPALVILSIFLLYPAVNTIWLSLLDANSEKFVGLENYGFVFTDDGMLRAIRNTLLWIIVVPGVSVSVGLGIAVLF